jgi:hypothetical protein
MKITEEEKELVKDSKRFAEKIMSGDEMGYDGADGAREVIKLCELIEKLIKE